MYFTVVLESPYGSSDKSEVEYRKALKQGDKTKIARLDAEAETRRQNAIKWLDENNA